MKKISLIMATYGRFTEVEAFCQILMQQTYQNFELIVVDQNEGDGLTAILTPFINSFELIHIQSDIKGLSANRNIGLKKAKGDIIAFPDDDCLYKSDTLEYVLTKMEKNNADYFCLNWHDIMQPKVFSAVSEEIKEIKKQNFFDVGSSITLFVKKAILRGFEFDEQLGVGAIFGSGEETDLLLFCLSKKAHCICDGTYYIHHPYKENKEINVSRSYNYALGYGAIMKKAFVVYNFHFALFIFIYALLKNLIGIIISPKRKHHLIALKGKIVGFCLYKKESE